MSTNEMVQFEAALTEDEVGAIGDDAGGGDDTEEAVAEEEPDEPATDEDDEVAECDSNDTAPFVAASAIDGPDFAAGALCVPGISSVCPPSRPP